MIFPEQNFRKICRSELGGYESAKFQEALERGPSGDPVAVTFDVGWQESKTILISRADAEQYARWAHEEQAPESQLLFYIKPQMHDWILSHRKSMCERLREVIAKYNPEYGPDIQIIWPIATPDVVPYEAAKKYVERYGYRA